MPTLWALEVRAEPAADEPRPSYTLSWVRADGAEGCPSRRDLAREVEGRLGRSPFDDSAAASIEIQVARRGSGYQSRVHVRAGDGKVLGQRLLESDDPSCGPIFSATALAVALLIDPEAALQKDAEASQAVGRFDAPSEPPKAATAPLAETPAGIEPAADTQEAPRQVTPAPGPAPSEPRSVRGLVSGEAVLALGLVPSGGPGAGLYVGGRVGPRFGFALSSFYLVSATAEANGAVFDVGLTAFALSGTLDLTASDRHRLSLEAGPMFGALHASVTSPIPTNPGDFFFIAVGAGLRGELGLGSGFFLSLRANGVVPLARRGLFVDPQDEPVWRQPPVAALGALGLGLTFF